MMLKTTKTIDNIVQHSHGKPSTEPSDCTTAPAHYGQRKTHGPFASRACVFILTITMGVLGLTRWTNDVERIISSEFTIPIPKGSGSVLENGEAVELNPEGDWLVIDAWAWIHYVWHSMNTNVYQGGSFFQFRVVLKSWIDTLRAAGFHILVVFDGPRLHQKVGALLARTENYVRLNAKLMRAGRNLRNDNEFMHARMLPRGLTEFVCSLLRSYDVEVIMGAEEVDGAVAQLANERAGYVLSRDSDFLILCANAPKCKGYIPLNTFEFIAMETAAPQPEGPPADDDGFTAVSMGKRSKKAAQQAKNAHLPHTNSIPVLPADAETMKQTALKFRCFSSFKCAEQLKLPMSILPVFAALVGTENRSRTQAELFGGLLHGVSNRMGVIASHLAEQYTAVKEGEAPPAAAEMNAEEGESEEDKNEAKAQLDMSDPVTRLLAQTFDSLVQFGRQRRGAPLPVSWAMRTEIVQSMHATALSYMPDQGCEAMDRFMAPTENQALKKYQDAYWNGHFDQALISTMLERIYIARVYLEEPEEPAAQRVIVRPMRVFVWSILFSTWFAAHPEEKARIEEALEKLRLEEEAAEREDKVEIEGENDDADKVAGNEGDGDEDDEESKEVDDEGEGESEPEPEPESEESGPPPLTTVTEYTRTEYALRKDEVPVHELPIHLKSAERMMPLPASLTSMVDKYGEALEAHMQDESKPVPKPVFAAELSDTERLDLWRYIHHSSIPELEKLPADARAFAAGMRYAIVTNHERLGSLRTRHNWSQTEVEAAVYSACVARRVSKEATDVEMQAIVNAYPKGSPSNRSITLSTTLGFVLQMSALLTQSLALADQIPNSRPMWEPPLFHASLGAGMDANAKKQPPSETWTRFEDPELYDTLLAVVMHGLEKRIGRTRTATVQKSQQKSGGRQRRHLGLLEETML